MIVDDEPFNHTSLKMILSNLGSVKIVNMFNGLEAVNYVKKLILENNQSVKLIIMDIDMPTMNGIQVN
jgi:CheY-like chemotaxis protein